MKKRVLQRERVENIDFDAYRGKSEEEIYNIVGENTANIEACDKTRNQKVKAYFLQDKNQDINKILTVFENKNKIEEIKIVREDEIMDLIGEYLYKY